MAEVDFRKQERPPSTKYFASDIYDLQGASKNELFDKYEDYKTAKEAHNACLFYATAYNETLLKRLEAEKPEFYEENNISKRLLVAHLVNNMCLPYTKYRGKVFRDTSVKIKEKQYLTDQVRRLYNGGDNFHPYI